MPPEQARGDHHRIDARAYVYALGATLYHLPAGRAPYPGPPSAALREVLAGPPPPVDRGRAGPIPRPPELIAACARAMEREPALRFPTAATKAFPSETKTTARRWGSPLGLTVMRYPKGLRPTAFAKLAGSIVTLTLYNL